MNVIIITNKCSATEQINNGGPFLYSLEITLAFYPPLITIYSKLNAV